MAIETIGEAYSLGWRVTVRCAAGKYERMHDRECHHSMRLDMETLVWTRGAAFPLARLDSRLKCPRCGSRRVALIFDMPSPARSVSSRSG
jgi:hypothetical protein